MTGYCERCVKLEHELEHAKTIATTAYLVLTGRATAFWEEVAGLLPTAAYSARKEILKLHGVKEEP